MVDGTGGADHAGAARHGELDGGAADPACGAVDEQRAPSPDAERVQAARGRLDGDGQRSGLGEAKRRRDRRVVGEQRQFGRARAVGGEPEHAIADGDVRDALTDLVDDARHLATRRLRELPAMQALAQLPVGRIDADRAHRDPDMAGPRVRVRKIHDLEDLRAPELAVAGCLHRSLLSSPNPECSACRVRHGRSLLAVKNDSRLRRESFFTATPFAPRCTRAIGTARRRRLQRPGWRYRCGTAAPSVHREGSEVSHICVGIYVSHVWSRCWLMGTIERGWPPSMQSATGHGTGDWCSRVNAAHLRRRKHVHT